ncbi:MAG: hypothetical protein GY751_20280 [Bacteroidetes bacterium]|nr:hypothetical protein [Bacteroidota bacterium]
MTEIPRDNMEAIYAYLMLEGFKGKELQQNGLVLAEIDALLTNNGYTTLFNNDTMFSKTALQNLYTAGKRTALGGRFGGRASTYPYGYRLVRQGSSEDNDGFKQPTRNLKLADYNRKSEQVDANVLNLARTGELTSEFQQTLTDGADLSMNTGGSTTTTTTEIPEVAEITEDVDEIMTIIPTVEIDDSVKILGAARGANFFDLSTNITPPTEDEQIAISLKAWKENQNPDKMWPYEGYINFTLKPSEFDASMQPTNTVVISETSEQGGAQSVDDFMMDMDDFMDESPQEIAVVNANANQPFFLTPEIQFGFKMGEAAYFQVVGGAAAETYAGQMFPITLVNTDAPAVVTKVEVAWNEPSGDFKSTDTIKNFKIELTQEGRKIELTMNELGYLVKDSQGAKYNESQEDGAYNTYGGMMEKVESNEVVIYSHGGIGFGGLPSSSEGEPIDTMVWANLNSSTAGLTGSVKVNAATDVPAVIRTQMSRFYGNSRVSDPRLNWKSWGDDPESVLTPIMGGDNVIFNFDPRPQDILADVKTYVDYHPEYLAPKLLNLTLTRDDKGAVPQETERTGVISPEIIFDDDGDIEDAVWSRVLNFEVTGGDASEYFGSSQKKTYVLPGDEQHLVFKDVDGNEVNVGKGQINYITYDKPSSIVVDGTLVARGVRLYCDGDKVIDIPTTQDTGEFWLQDPNGKSVGGTIKGGELSPPAPEIVILNESATEAWNERRKARRREKQSERFTNRDETGAVVTRSIAFKSSPTTKEYFVLAETSEGFKIMKIDLDIRRD